MSSSHKTIVNPICSFWAGAVVESLYIVPHTLLRVETVPHAPNSLSTEFDPLFPLRHTYNTWVCHWRPSRLPPKPLITSRTYPVRPQKPVNSVCNLRTPVCHPHPTRLTPATLARGMCCHLVGQTRNDRSASVSSEYDDTTPATGDVNSAPLLDNATPWELNPASYHGAKSLRSDSPRLQNLAYL